LSHPTLERVELGDPWTALLVSGGCLVAGIAAGLRPVLGIALAVGIAFILIVLADLTWGLVAFVLLSFFDVVQFQGGSLTFTKLAGLALCGSWLATIATDDRRTGNDFFARHPRYVLVLALFLGWTALSAVWAEEIGPVLTSVQRYGLNMLLIPVIYTALRERRHVAWVLAAFVFGALASTAYGLVLPAPPDPYGSSRLGGAIGESNETATVLVAAIVLSAGLVIAVRRSPLLTVGAMTAAVLALAGLVNTLSRAGLISLGFSLVAAVILGGRWRKYAMVLTVIILAASMTYFLAIAPSLARSRVASTNSTGRSDLWKVALRAVGDHPLRGIGADNFRVSSVHYLVQPGVTTRADFIVTTPKVVHNVYLEQLTGLGIIGLALFLSILGASFRCSFLAARQFKEHGDLVLEISARATMIALIGVLAADFFASQQYSKQLWFLIAMGPALLGLGRQRPAS